MRDYTQGHNDDKDATSRIKTPTEHLQEWKEDTRKCNAEYDEYHKNNDDDTMTTNMNTFYFDDENDKYENDMTN